MASDTNGPVDSRKKLMSASFIGLLITQLLGAVNDNVFRWLVIGIGKQHFDPQHHSMVLMAGTVLFVVPYLALSAAAGYLADRYSKRSVIVGCKIAELVIMALGIGAIVAGQFWPLLVVVAMMGGQSALFGPSKLGSIPEMVRPERLSAANGLMGLSTVIATVIGMGVGNLLSDVTGDLGRERWWMSAAVLLGIALIGWLTSLMIVHLTPADPSRRFLWNPISVAGQTWRDIRLLASNKALMRVAMGIVFFWSVGSLAQLNIDQFAAEGGATLEVQKVPLLATLVFGVGVGSVIAGIWSGPRVELGILPLGAGGVAITSMLLFTVNIDLIRLDTGVTLGMIIACTLLFLLGFSSGLFQIPLAAYMQHHSEPRTRGSILAASNFLTFTGILITAGLFSLMRMPDSSGEPMLSARKVFFVAGLITIPVFLYIVLLIPQASLRFFVWLLSKTFYRITVCQRNNLPERDGALLVANHISWIDGILLLLTSSRPVRMLVFAGNFRNPLIRKIVDKWGGILIESGPKSIVRALATAREALENGELVCIFPEGGITRSGQLQGFRPGMMRIVRGTNAPIVPVYLDGLWGSIFSFERGRFFWKWPRRIPYPISIHFGRPIKDVESVHQIRQAVAKLGVEAVEQRTENMLALPRAFIRRCKQRKYALKIADSSGAELTGGSLLMRTLILLRLLLRHVFASDEKHVGILLPPMSASLATNMAVTLSRRIAVNLNYTVTSEVLNHCIKECGIKHVLTSRKFMEKMNFDLDVDLVYLEDLKDEPTLVDKLVGALSAFLVPARMIEKKLGLDQIKPDDVLTVIFTSGSTGMPKGVMLTYRNVGSNAEVIEQVIHLNSNDVLVGILPLFHSLGYTVTMWTVMAVDIQGVYHYSPLDSKQVGKLCGKYGGTILLSTPTFLRGYLRRCTAEDFSKLDAVVTGAERLAPDVADAFEEKFGVRPVEGYGTTELSPLAAVNIPPSRSGDNFQQSCKEGSVGRPVPGVSAKVIDRETGEPLGVDKSGMLLITGPNVMKGYLNEPEKTAAVIQDGWYVTGDIAKIDANGFVTITGRESRFSKIGGEMVPHVLIEETLGEIISSHGDSEDDALRATVTAVSDPKKGERLVVVHTHLEQTPADLREGLSKVGLPNLYLPSPDSFIEVDELPILGSGKLDLKGVKQIAEEKFAGEGG